MSLRSTEQARQVFEDDICFRSENEHELMANNLSNLQDVTVPQVYTVSLAAVQPLTEDPMPHRSPTA